jgi:hypothetical protein
MHACPTSLDKGNTRWRKGLACVYFPFLIFSYRLMAFQGSVPCILPCPVYL